MRSSESEMEEQMEREREREQDRELAEKQQPKRYRPIHYVFP